MGEKRKTARNQAVFRRFGGEGETRTLAPVTRPTPLAGAPRHQLEYFSIDNRLKDILLFPERHKILTGVIDIITTAGCIVKNFLIKRIDP